MKIRTAIATVAVMAATTMTTAFAQAGADTYKAKCAMCHGADGLAGTPAGKAMGAKPFTAPDYAKATDADLIAATKNGKGKMPAFATKLSDAEIKGAVSYIRTLQKK